MNEPGKYDRKIGRRIRAARVMAKMSRSALAEALGLGVQQVQKYENASNRVPAARLFEIAVAVSQPIDFFFNGLDDAPCADRMLPQNAIQAAQILVEVPSGDLRDQLIRFIEALEMGEFIDGE